VRVARTQLIFANMQRNLHICMRASIGYCSDMIEAETCLILGAGASAPYGLPTGTELRDLILVTHSVDGPETALKYGFKTGHSQRGATASSALNDWNNFLLNQRTSDPGAARILQEFRAKFHLARTASIDKFLQRNMEQFGDIGKRQLASVLLNCERHPLVDKGWYMELFSQICPRPEALKHEMLSVVTFNYDRSFEFFFWPAFKNTFALSDDDTNELFNRIKIVHVYGDLGDQNDVPYGHVQCVDKSVERIQLMREGQCSNSDSISKLVSGAKNICFIGFSFAEENLAIFNRSDFKGKRVFATALGLPPNDQAAAKKALGPIRFFDTDAETLLQRVDIFRGTGNEQVAETPRRTMRKPNWANQGRGWTL